MKNKKFIATLLLATAGLGLTGCMGTEVDQVSHNISQEADNFNITRKITVVNIRTDNVLFEMIGTFSIQNNNADELEVICEVGDGVYKKHFIYLNEWTSYVIEDISGANIDKYHYELNILPEYGYTITHND